MLAAPGCRLRQAHRRRNREVGQGDPGGQHQGGMKRRFTGNSERDVYETSPPTISASGRGRCRAAGRLALSHGRRAYPSRPVRDHRRLCRGRPDRHPRARLMGQWLSERLGQPFVIENRPGAGTNIATEAVVRAPARWLYASLGQPVECHQRDALREAQFQFHPRHRASRGNHPRSQSSWW